MKLIAVIILSISTFTAIAQRSLSTCDSINWSADRKLTWADFKSPANGNNPFAAMTYESIYYNYNFRNTTLFLQTRAYFVPCLSWTKHSESDNLLQHEQGHFDIAELSRRLLNKAIADADLKFASIKADIVEIYNKIYDQKHELHSKYDKETDYSRNKEKQLQWLKKIQRLLEDLQDHSGESVSRDIH